MRYYIILSSFIFCLISCKKEEGAPNTTDPQTNLSKIADSCSYTIDGMQFICDKPSTDGRGNAGANLDTTNNSWKWDSDSIQYRVMYGLDKISNTPAPNDGRLIIYFVKKYGKNQLINPIGGIMAPVTDTPLYLKGIQNYAIDYNRFNRQDGIALEVTNRTGTSSEILLTYINASPFSSTTLKNDCQENSQFEIINVNKLPNGGRIIEAKFTANLFDKYERIKRLENGYLRINVE